MNRIVRIIAAKELSDLFRDRRTIISMILIPIVAIPLLISGMVWISMKSMEKMQDKTSQVALLGEDFHPQLAAELYAIDKLEFLPTQGLSLDSLFASGALAIVELDENLPTAYVRLHEEVEDSPYPQVLLHYDSTQDKAKMAARILRSAMQGYRLEEQKLWFQEINLRAECAEPWAIVNMDTATPERHTADMLSRFLPYMILILCLQGAMYPAMDLTAGEKERQTLETLLVNPVSRLNIVLGKYLAVSTMAFGSTIFTLLGQFVFFHFFADSITDGKVQLSLDPFILGVSLLVLLPAVMFFSTLLILISTWARSMKEAQSYLGPLTMLVIFPSMASMIPGLELNLSYALIPIFNVALIVREVLMSNFDQAPLMVLCFFVNSLYAMVALWLTVHAFRSESVLFRS
jgi:sodium transport system permease protein